MQSPIQHELTHHQYLLEKLRADFPDADEQTLADTVDGLTNLTEMLGAVVRSQLDYQALASALRARIAAMQERLSRLESGAAKKRSLVTSVMERAHVMKLVQADFTASLRATQAPLILTDEANIPSDYWRPQPPKLDRQGLIRALKAGHTILGATLGNGGLTISVRTG